MSGFPLIFCFATVVVFSHLAFVEGQDFCESYQKNNYSLIVFSQSNDTILLIVDKHFWRLREEGKQLVFVRNDFQASNSSEQWTETNYTFAHPLYLKAEFQTFRGIVLFKYKESIFNTEGFDHKFQGDYYEINGNYFDKYQFSKEWSDPKDNNRISISIFDKRKDFEVIQKFDHTLKKFVTERVAFNDGNDRYLTFNWTEESIGTQIYTQIEKLRNFTNDMPFIGSYLNSKNEILFFFRIKDDIKYCTIEQCDKNNYTVLISCQLKNKTIDKTIDTTIDIWIPIAIICVIIVVFVIIVLIVIYCLKKSRRKTAPKYELASASTVQTINSETGLPLHPSKIKKPATNGQRVSSPKPQIKTESSKPNVVSKPKKSPKTKK